MRRIYSDTSLHAQKISTKHILDSGTRPSCPT